MSTSLKTVVSQVLISKIGGGRVCVQEIMVSNAAIMNLIRALRARHIGKENALAILKPEELLHAIRPF